VRADPGKACDRLFSCCFHVVRRDPRCRLGKEEKRPRFGAFSLFRIVPKRRMLQCATTLPCNFSRLIKHRGPGAL
jgi:hypothetical protein